MSKKKDKTDLLALKYIPLDEALNMIWTDNPKLHKLESMITALAKYGFSDPAKYDSSIEGLVHGNGRIQAVGAMYDRGMDPPAGIAVDSNGRWAVPILFGNDIESQLAAVRYAIDHNNLTLAGGGFSAVEIARLYDSVLYQGLLDKLQDNGRMPVTVDEDDLEKIFAGVDQKELDKQNAWLDDFDLDEDDGFDREETPEPGVIFRVGPYTTRIPRLAYDGWIDSVKVEVGHNRNVIQDEIVKRLQL